MHKEIEHQKLFSQAQSTVSNERTKHVENEFGENKLKTKTLIVLVTIY